LFNDLRKLGVTPEEGMKLNFYDRDAGDLERPQIFVLAASYVATKRNGTLK